MSLHGKLRAGQEKGLIHDLLPCHVEVRLD